MSDAYPLTDRLTWSVLRGIDRVKRIRAIDVVYFCGVGVIYGFGLWVGVQWIFGA